MTGTLPMVHNPRREAFTSSYHCLPTMCPVAPRHFIPPTLLKVPVPDAACRWQNHCHSATLSCVMLGLKTKKPHFPGLCQLYFWFGSAEERPWYDVERQEEERRILAHLRAGSWPGRCCCSKWLPAPAATITS